MNWMILPLRRYFEMRGRSRRREFWAFSLALMLVQLAVLLGLGNAGFYAQVNGGAWAASWWSARSIAWGDIVSNAISLLTLIPSITLTTRRLHDIDRSGW
jgi:uncharacterized membrane protein YhaH (DUF805 family)